jgi:hypothetical protein
MNIQEVLRRYKVYSKILFTYKKDDKILAIIKANPWYSQKGYGATPDQELPNGRNQISKSIKADKSLSEFKNHEKGALALMKKMQALDEDVTYQEVTPVLTQDFMVGDYRETWQLVYCYK